MTLVVNVTKRPVTETQRDLYGIVLNMTVTDGVDEVINKDYTAPYRPKDTISKKKNRFVAQMQKDIDAYKSEQVIYKKAAIATLAENVKNALEV